MHKEKYYSLLRAASSAIITTSLCNCKIEAGTSGVIGPLIVFAMASALSSPQAIKSIFLAFIMLPIPML